MRHGEDVDRLTVLIVDDDPNNLKVAVDALDSYGFKVLIARTGERGIERAERLTPDLILLDVGLPGVDGYEVCRRLATNERTRSIPVIFMTAHANEDDKIRGFDVGAVDYLTKPVSERELLARLRIQLQVKSLRAQVEAQRRTIGALSRRINELAPPQAVGPVAAPEPERADPFAPLSPRERQVARLLVAGRANKEIAFELSLSQTTISTHRARILDKLGLAGLTDLIKLALGRGVEA